MHGVEITKNLSHNLTISLGKTMAMQATANKETFRQYLLFFSGQQVSLLGSSIVQFVVVWWITVETGSPVYLSLAALAGFAPLVILSPFGGVLVDRFSRKRVILIADLCQTVATIVLILCFWLDLASIYVVLGIILLRGVFQAFHMPAVNAIIPSMVPQDKLSRINSLEYVFNGIVQVSGPVIAALLLTFVSIDQLLWIDPITFVAAILVLLIVKIPSVRSIAGKSTFRQDFTEGISYLRKATGFIPLIFLAVALNFLITPFSTLLPYFVKFDHLGGAANLALVQAFLQGGFIAGGLFMLLTKGFRRKVLASIISLLIGLTGYALVSLTPMGLFWFMAVAVLIFTIPIPVTNISVRTILQIHAPLEIQGRITSVVISLASIATPVSMILSGVLASYIGTSTLFLSCALIGIFVTILCWFFTDIRKLEKLQDIQGAQSTSSV